MARSALARGGQLLRWGLALDCTNWGKSLRKWGFFSKIIAENTELSNFGQDNAPLPLLCSSRAWGGGDPTTALQREPCRLVNIF